jgi:hypothetical protein
MTLDQEHRRKRVIDIAMQMVASKIKKGELDPNDDDALRKATKLAVSDAAAAYDAAEEYVSG